MANNDPFTLDKGMKDDYIGTVKEAWYGTGDYNQGKTLLLNFKIAADDGEEVDQFWPCGPDWASFDGGETAEHPSKKRFNENTAIGKLFASMFAIDECMEILRSRNEEDSNLHENRDLGPRLAALFPGLTFHWTVESEHMKFKDKETGDWIERDVPRLTVDQFIGVDAGIGTDGAAAPATGDVAAPAQETSDDPLASLPAESVAKIKVLAKTKPYAEWVDAVMEIPEAAANTDFMVKLGDEAFYMSLRG